VTLDEDQTHAINPAPNAAGWDFDSDLDDAMLTDEEDDAVQQRQQQFAPQDQSGGANNWNAPDGDDDDSLKSIWRQFAPVLIPVPFALIIFLFSLLANAHGIANLAPLPLGIILVALAIIQGTALYYSGNNDTYWTLSLIGGYLLFMLVGAFVFFGLGGAVLLLVIILLLSLVLGGRAIHPVPEGRVDLVQRFGRYARTLYPGFNLLFPWERIYAHARTKELTWISPPQRITTSHNQVVDIVASVTYQLLPEDAHIAVTHVEDWEADLHQHFLSVLKSVVYELKPADLIGWAHELHSRPQIVDELANPIAETRWDRLNAAVQRRLQDQVATRGIKINMVHVQDITVISQPSSPVMPANAGLVRGQPARPVEPAPAPSPLSARQAAFAAQPTVPAPAPPAPATLPAAAQVPTQAAPAPAPVPASPIVLNDVKMQSMIGAFNAVREGRITDPTTIFNLADRFEEIANNPELDRVFPYDARKAARVLRDRATYIKARRDIEARHASTSAPANPAPAPAERAARRLPTPSNDNLAAGG
jgi:regulator of protease activity HflC (stomatin/prohibitin superfamily)